jgi:two-component system NtrC family sensor kinase
MPETEKAKGGYKQKVRDFLNALFHPHDYFSILGKDRYKSLKIRIILIDAMLSLLPLFIVVTISYFWFQHILKKDFRNQVKWQIENTTQSIEFFVDEKVSALRFLASSYTFEQLSDQKMLTDIFSKFEKEFAGLVDLGVIDSNGIQQSYAGPYPLTGKDYSNQEWFHEVVVRNVYVSDVFMGYRRLPHFAIAVKKDCPEKRPFCIIRATIDMKTLKRFASNINLRENDDAFVINHDEILQTPSRFHGNVLERFSLPILPSQQGVSVLDIKEPEGGRAIFGYEPIENSPWILVAIIKSTPYSRIPKIFRNELLLIGIGSVLIGIAVTFLMAQTVVNRIKKADEETEDAIAQTEHVSKLASVGRLAAGVAHEFNNPLAIILGFADLLLEKAEPRSKEYEMLKAIERQGLNCKRIVENLLGFARYPEKTEYCADVNESLESVVSVVENILVTKNITLEKNLAEDLPRVRGDSGHLQQVFMNLITNAVAAMEEGGGLTISTRLNEPGKRVEILFKDTGCGIKREHRRRIFDPFFTTREVGEGTGLGLSVCYGIVTKYGGEITFETVAEEEDRKRRGTTFTVSLPVISSGIEKCYGQT